MVTKKKRRTDEIRGKKKKKKMKKSLLFLIVATIVACLILFFVILFEYVFPPTQKNAVKKEKQEVVLYFSDANERFLIPEKRYISKEESPEDRAKEIVKALLDGSKTKLVNTFPEKVTVESVKIDDKQIAYVSFDENLIKYHPGGSASEMATIYSLTNSLTRNISDIKAVRVLIGGKEVESLKGHIDTRQPFHMNKELLAPGSKEG
jgi:Na+-transporting NADH:ubiquinone oxidoreductase subunit NqrC